MKVGDIVEYNGREWYLYSLYSHNLCQIVALRDGKYTHNRQGEEVLNANIVNLDIGKIRVLN